jgi:hypothetical protein
VRELIAEDTIEKVPVDHLKKDAFNHIGYIDQHGVKHFIYSVQVDVFTYHHYTKTADNFNIQEQGRSYHDWSHIVWLLKNRKSYLFDSPAELFKWLSSS